LFKPEITKEVIMSVKVKTQYLRSFNMPLTCVACGDPPAPEAKWKVSGTKTEQKWSSTEYKTLSLEFPLCQECQTASRNSWPGRIVSWLGIPIAGVIALFGIAMLASGNATPLICLSSFFGLGIAVVGARELGNLISQRGMSPEQRERRKLVKNCARIKRFGKTWREHPHVLFEFENTEFAKDFATMNAGTVEI
jgi:hypothetical protein